MEARAQGNLKILGEGRPRDGGETTAGRSSRRDFPKKMNWTDFLEVLESGKRRDLNPKECLQKHLPRAEKTKPTRKIKRLFLPPERAVWGGRHYLVTVMPTLNLGLTQVQQDRISRIGGGRRRVGGRGKQAGPHGGGRAESSVLALQNASQWVMRK